MHMLTVTLIGLLLVLAFVLVARSINKRKNRQAVDGARIFIWFWLAVSMVDFCVGVFVANYPVATEIGVHIVVFGLPAGVAWYLSRKFRSKV
jgi:hypothetical protein